MLRIAETWRGRVSVAGIVFLAVLAASLFGILTRPFGFLAAFWPANALLLGLFVRWPRLATAPGWLGAVAGYLAADFVTGGALLLTLWLTATNLTGVLVGFLLFKRLDRDHRALRRPLSVLYLFGILLCSSACAAFVGGGAAVVYFQKDLALGLVFWFATELVNGIIVLPVILTAPSLARLRPVRRAGDLRSLLITLAPAFVLAASTVAGALVGGAAALAFPSPALLWCALTYPLFATVLLTMLVSIWQLMAHSLGHIFIQAAQMDGATVSDRLGIMLLALGPLTVSSINASRRDLLQRLERLASHDALTGALTRASFLSRSDKILSEQRPGQACAILMIDLDHFKKINDGYGHHAGDIVLGGFAEAVRGSLRQNDLFGRLGGEEFAVLLPVADAEEALAVAERLRAAAEQLRFPVSGGDLRCSASIGMALQSGARTRKSLNDLLRLADAALYRAKADGRNRVVQDAATGA